MLLAQMSGEAIVDPKEAKAARWKYQDLPASGGLHLSPFHQFLVRCQVHIDAGTYDNILLQS